MPPEKTPSGRRILACNLAALIGVGLLGYGLWQWSPALAQVTIGALMLVAAILGRLR